MPAEAGVHALHIDTHLLVVEKPAGLLAVPGRGADKQDCLSARVQAAWPDALVVHRLDMATSGLVLFARSLDVQRRLGQAFADRQVKKRYTAIVAGPLRPDPAGVDAEGWATIDLPLAADWPRRPMQKVDTAAGKPSLTRWRVSQEDRGERQAKDPAGSTRLVLEPVTGRTHQLRVHLQAIGHPILGDMLYAGADIQAQAPRLLLHASALALVHPATGEALAFASPAPF
ncbi:MAG: RluA family pseudouridine synthase [Pseudomonadota bacterium]